MGENIGRSSPASCMLGCGRCMQMDLAWFKVAHYQFWGFLDGYYALRGKCYTPWGARRMRANAVPGVFSVKNELKIANTKTA